MPREPTLKGKAVNLPAATGVYWFLDRQRQILYVGKARNLKTRIQAYFREGGDGRPQVPFLMDAAEDLHFMVTGSEREALILENNLIKENHPKYNIFLKDDKSYQTIRVHRDHPFPGISVVRRKVPEERYHNFGPYCSGRDVALAMKPLQKIFKLRDCSDAEFARRHKPCLKYQIRLCSGPCAGLIAEADYRDSVQSALSLLGGKSNQIRKILATEREAHAGNLQFEKAAEIHQQIQALESLRGPVSGVSGFRKDGDAVGFARHGQEILFQVLIVRRGQVISGETHAFRDVPGEPPELIETFLDQYYRDGTRIPDEIWLDLPPENTRVLQSLLCERKGGDVRLRVPRRGSLKSAVTLATKNASSHLESRAGEKEVAGLLAERIMKALNLGLLPSRIEGYDISHAQGRDAVGVRVTFQDGKPLKGAYRRYHIRNPQSAGDDYASLYEVFKRRITRGLQEGDLPDLWLIDGGPAQLQVLQRAADDFQLSLQAAAIAKESHARNSRDRVFKLGRKNPLPLAPSSPVLRKFQEIRDEAHRFALAFHHIRRRKRIFGDKS